MTSELTSKLFMEMMRSGNANIAKHVDEINELNVFPIPDGDTGDNMLMTVSECETLTFRKDISDMLHAVAQSTLMNARGNSGVILSQLFAGFADGIVGLKTANVNQIKSALNMAVDRAYSAVAKPVEGTILTVAKDSVEAVNKSKADSVEDVMDIALKEARKSLARTPELLDALKKAGVVDSGGAGLVYILEGMAFCLQGVPVSSKKKATKANEAVDVSFFTENSVLEYGYCTELLLRLQTSKVNIQDFDTDKFISDLKKYGSSIVAFRDGTLIKLHIHTMFPNKVLRYCQKRGEFLKIKIENMMLQHNEIMRADIEKKCDKRAFGIVAVATGKGIRESFKNFGADEIIFGGQTKNPSSKDFTTSFDRVNAKTIFVLPNNSNIILAAKQAAKMYTESDVRVIPSKTIGDGYAILSMLNMESGDTDTIEKEMIASMKGIVTAEISKSIREVNMDGVCVKEGDYIGIVGDKIISCGDSALVAAESFIEKYGVKNRAVAIIIRGKSGTKKQSTKIMKTLRKASDSIEIYDVYGGQEVYDFLIVLE